MRKKLFTLFLAVAASIGTMLAENVIYSETFSASQGSFTIDNKSLSSGLTYVWKWKSANYGMVASAYVSNTIHESESWLISPSISLVNYSSATLSFDHAVNKGAPTNFKVKISTDGGSTWSELAISQWPAGTNWTFLNATVSLDAYVGKNIKIAFCYVSTSSLAPQWEIKAFAVKANGTNTNSSSFVGFSADNRLGEQIYAEDLIQDKVNVTLEETDTQNHKYNINLVTGGTGSFTMGGIKFLYSNSEAGKTAYKTYVTYIQPNGADREIHIPTVAGEIVTIDLTEACAGILVDGVATDFVAGGNTIVAKGDSIVLRNTNAKPKIMSILLKDNNKPVDGDFKIGDLYYKLDSSTKTAMVSDGPFKNPYTNLKILNIPDQVELYGKTFHVVGIEDQTFEHCDSLTSVTIPNSVTSIGSMAFYGCNNIINVIWNARNCNGYNFGSQVESFVFGEEVEVIPSSICNGMNQLTEITIPNSVTSIGDAAFYYCTSLTSVTIPNSVTSIGNSAFWGCSGLTGELVIPNSVTSIGGGAFFYCSGLTSVTIGNSVTSIEAHTFNGCTGLTSIDIPNSVTSIGYMAFEACRNLYSVTIDEGVSHIDSDAFYLCSNVTIVVWKAKNCNGYNFGKQVKSFTFGNKVEVIPDGICSGMRIESINIPNTVTSIGSGAFSECRGLTSVTIPNSVTSIGGGAFYYCSGLTFITIPNSVTSIGNDAFACCYGLTSVTNFANTPQEIGSYIFDNVDKSTCVLYVPAGSISAYKSANQWKDFSKILPIEAQPADVTTTTVTPSETTADIAWPQVTGAATYTIEIKKNGELICTLIFNAQGQLISIAFAAPSRNNAPQQAQAAGFSFTITGLESGTTYSYTMKAKGNNGNVLKTESGTFTTTGESQGIEEVSSSLQGGDRGRLILRDGQIFILRGEKVYTLQGQKVK